MAVLYEMSVTFLAPNTPYSCIAARVGLLCQRSAGVKTPETKSKIYVSRRLNITGSLVAQKYCHFRSRGAFQHPLGQRQHPELKDRRAVDPGSGEA